MSRKSCDVLNKTWTIIDEEEVEAIVEEENEDDINNNTKCIPNKLANETYLFNNGNKKKIIEVVAVRTTTTASPSQSQNSSSNQSADLDGSFQKLFNISSEYISNGLAAIEKLIKRSIATYDALQSELFFDATIENYDLMNEHVKLLSMTGASDDMMMATTPQLTIPQSFDVFLSDLTTTKNRKSIHLVANENDDYKRSTSEVDLTKNNNLVDSNLSSSASSSAANLLLEVKTSSPLKKRRFFSSNDDHLDEEKMDVDEYDENEEEKEKPVFNLTYTSMNTNDEQIENEFINQNLNNNNDNGVVVAKVFNTTIDKESTKAIEQRQKKRESVNLNRTFSIEDDEDQLHSLPTTVRNETILISDAKRVVVVDAPVAQYTSLPTTLQTAPPQLKPQISNSKIPKPGGIPRMTQRISSTSSSTGTSASSSTSSSASISSTKTSTAAATQSIPQLAEVKNQNLVKTSLTTIAKKSPQHNSLSQVGQNKLRPSDITGVTYKENKLINNNDALRRVTVSSNTVRTVQQQQQQQNEVKTSPSANKVASLSTKSQNVNQNNGEVKSKILMKPGSMIPSFKATTTVKSNTVTSTNKKSTQ